MELRFKIEGMACTACEAAVERAVLAVAGVESAAADLGQGMLTVQCVQAVRPDEAAAIAVQVQASVNAASYEASWLGCESDVPAIPAEQARVAAGIDAESRPDLGAASSSSDARPGLKAGASSLSVDAGSRAHSGASPCAGGRTVATSPSCADDRTAAMSSPSAVGCTVATSPSRSDDRTEAAPSSCVGSRTVAASSSCADGRTAASPSLRAIGCTATAPSLRADNRMVATFSSCSDDQAEATPSSCAGGRTTAMPSSRTDSRTVATSHSSADGRTAATPSSRAVGRTVAGPSSSNAAERARRIPRPLVSIAVLAGAILLLVALQQLGLGAVFLAFPTVGTTQMAYGALFLVGLMTSVHCVAMCGGLNLSQSLMGESTSRFAAVVPSIQYNLGRLISYTAVGALLGLLGSAISISVAFRCVVGVLAGAFMVVLGLSLMGLVRPDALSRLLPKSFARRLAQGLGAFRRRGPFVLGLANGFMPCGPLQAMQLYALACGGMLEGALSLFFFCLGTVPLMFATGSVLGALKARWRRVLMQAGGTLLLLFGIVAAGNGLALAGIDVPLPTSTSLASQGGAGQAVRATMGADGIQRATVEVDYGSYQNVVLASGVPAQITFHVPDGKLIGCNASLSIPAFDVEVELQAGDTTVSLPAAQAGRYPYTCWMGMIKAAITVE